MAQNPPTIASASQPADRAPPDQFAEFVITRSTIEQAKGALMLIYEIDADEAFDLLRWQSQLSNVKLHALAKRLLAELVALAPLRMDMRSACDNLFLTVHQRSLPAASPVSARDKRPRC